MSSNITFQKICNVCGESFTAQKSSTKYCSKVCNNRAYKTAKKEQLINSVELNDIIEDSQREVKDVTDREYLSVQEAATLLGVSRHTVYRMLHRGDLKAIQLSHKLSIIKRSDIDSLFQNTETYKATPSVERAPITEFYTIAQIKERFGVKERHIYNSIKKHSIPKTLIRGKSHVSKKHIDKLFANRIEDSTITEWYSVEDLQAKYHLTKVAIYTFVSENKIPKKKEGIKVFYSQSHFDRAKGHTKAEEPEYYTVAEATAKFNISRDALYHHIKYHNIAKIKEGKFIKILKAELDKIFEEPIII